MDKLKLGPTAAVVMKWMEKSYIDEMVLQFMDQFDLSSGDELLVKCNNVCNWYDEVIKNRKYFIKQLIERKLSSIEEECQLIFFASGKSPLAIELFIKNNSKINIIFEIDIVGMEEKKKIYDKICPNFSEKIRCINADITENIMPILKNTGYRNDINSIILLEGISYYISKTDMKRIIDNFKCKNNNIIIIEYLKPCKYVNENRIYIPKGIFKSVEEYSGLRDITCYTEDELKLYIDNLENYAMSYMEYKRTGTNAYFKNPEDGWLECAIGVI